MDRVVGWELEIKGSHGMQAHRYPAMLELIRAGKLAPEKLVTGHIALAAAPAALMGLDRAAGPGISVITSF
jgi:alcohol dehydrogenase